MDRSFLVQFINEIASKPGRWAWVVGCLLGCGWPLSLDRCYGAEAGQKPSLPLALTQHPLYHAATPSGQVAPENLPAEMKQGYELAHLYCQACHSFPDPSLLDKKTWVEGALKKMAPLLGVGKLNLEKRADGGILAASGIFPKTSLISESDWKAIVDYYQTAAPETAPAQEPHPSIHPTLKQFTAEPLGYRFTNASITLVQFDPAQKRLLVGDAYTRALHFFDIQGTRLRSFPMRSVPVSAIPKTEGLYALEIGHVFPSDELDGRLVWIDTRSETNNKVQMVVDHLRRPVSFTLCDLNQDGREDFLISCFGNYLGRLSWYESKASGHYEEHVLIPNPGALGSWVRDFNHDGQPDVVALMAQARESIRLLMNRGKGEFEESVLAEFPPVFGCTHLEWVDWNRDGIPDVLMTNGDNGEYPSPFKNYHGIRLFLSDAQQRLRLAYFYPMNGAFKAVAADFDGDGDLDIAAISYFPDYQHTPNEGFVYLENKGDMQFEAFSFPESTSGRWMTMDAEDLDGDGDVDLVLGSFQQGPSSITVPTNLRQRWATNGIGVMMLKNKLR